MRNTTEMRDRLRAARAVLSGDAIAARRVMVTPISGTYTVTTWSNVIPPLSYTTLEPWANNA